MNTFISSLCATLSSPALWSMVGFVVPILAISVLFGLGYNLLSGILWNINNPSMSVEELRHESKNWNKTWDI